jgi:expansin (peptidoglycan-binding protein)
MSAPSYCDTANDGSSENVVALSADIMTQALCGSTITVTHAGKTAQGTVVDRCAGCSAGSVDMSEHMFGDLADMAAGRIPITWTFDN